MKNNRVIIIALAITVILSCLILVIFLGTDHEGPTITVDSSAVEPYASEQGTDVLKQYAQAVDKVDGNVSDSIIVENVYVMTDLESAKVVYTARDKKNNISKLSYMIDYIASDEEIAHAEGLQNTEETTEAETTSDETGSATTTASNSKTTSSATTTAATTEAATQEGAPLLTLSASEGTISTGTTFYISKYVESITDDTDSMTDLAKRIIIKGDYSTKTAGNYTLDIYCTDKDQNESNHVAFVLHVK